MKTLLTLAKSPAESKPAWHDFKLVATLPGDQVFLSREESRCALWK